MGIKRILLGLLVVGALDLLLPTVTVVGAQIAIAPAIIAAIIGAVGSAAAAEKQKQAGLAAASGQGAAGAGGEGGIDMEPIFEKAMAEVASSFKSVPGSEHQAAIEAADAPPISATGPMSLPSVGGGGVADQPMTAGIGMDKIDVPEITDTQKLPEKEGGLLAGMSTEDKLAMAASLGSLLRGPGAPPPPGAPSGGQGINMSPVFQNVTLRDLGRR